MYELVNFIITICGSAQNINGNFRPYLSVIHAKNRFPKKPPAHNSAAINEASSMVNFASRIVSSDDK